MGLTLAIVFQLAHVVKGTAFEHADDSTRKLDTAWAEYQVRTTVDFARNNKLISWLVGGLNFQIEHHLFPRISHIHYPAISKIVQATCIEYNLPYLCMPGFGAAVQSHFQQLRLLGQKPRSPYYIENRKP